MKIPALDRYFLCRDLRRSMRYLCTPKSHTPRLARAPNSRPKRTNSHHCSNGRRSSCPPRAQRRRPGLLGRRKRRQRGRIKRDPPDGQKSVQKKSELGRSLGCPRWRGEGTLTTTCFCGGWTPTINVSDNQRVCDGSSVRKDVFWHHFGHHSWRRQYQPGLSYQNRPQAPLDDALVLLLFFQAVKGCKRLVFGTSRHFYLGISARANIPSKVRTHLASVCF